jgi:hypothetical protein
MHAVTKYGTKYIFIKKKYRLSCKQLSKIFTYLCRTLISLVQQILWFSSY